MIPGHYFKTDDGSLPEVEVTFAVPSHMVAAFAHLFACGARDATCGEGSCGRRANHRCDSFPDWRMRNGSARANQSHFTFSLRELSAKEPDYQTSASW